VEKEGGVIPGQEEYGVALAFVLINTEIGAEESVVATLKNIEEVKEAYLAYGVYDIVAKIEARDMVWKPLKGSFLKK